MDINEYISSGILELYVAGALPDEENREVEEMARLHAEVRDEIEAIQRALEMLTRASHANPRPELRSVILEEIHQLETKNDASRDGVITASLATEPIPLNGTTATPVAPTVELSADALSANASPEIPSPAASVAAPAHAASTVVTPARASSGETIIPLPSRTRYLLAASITIAIMSSAAAGYFAYRWQSTERELAAVNVDNGKIVEEQRAMKARLDRSNADLAVLRSRDNRVVEMKGLPIAPGALATVYWNPATHEVHLDKGTLPAPPPGKQYQLWAIADGKPVDAGMIADGMEDTELAPMKSVASAQAFAVTLEPEGGSSAPTLDAMYVMGKLAAESI